MSLINTPRPEWLTFDCYGTLIQWDEGLQAVVARLLADQGAPGVAPATLIAIHDRHEHALEQTPPHRSFRDVSAMALQLALGELGLVSQPGDGQKLTDSIALNIPASVGAKRTR